MSRGFVVVYGAVSMAAFVGAASLALHLPQFWPGVIMGFATTLVTGVVLTRRWPS